MPDEGEVTRLLRAHVAGDSKALDRLMPIVYEELRRIARSHLRGAPGPRRLDTTSLVHETYLKLAAAEALSAQDRKHLMAIAAAAMRQVVIDRARAELRQKRGGGAPEVDLQKIDIAVGPPSEWLLDLDRALTLLRGRDERMARVFECRFFADLTDAETADALDLTVRTVQRDWMRARAWLKAELGSGPDGPRP